MSPVNFTACAEHLAQEYHAQRSRLGERMDIMAPYDWNDVPANEQELDTAVMRSLLYRGIIVCPRPEHRVTITLRDGSVSADVRHRSTKDCPCCGVWTCGNCGWKRHDVALSRPDAQTCHRCGATEGRMEPTRHAKRAWLRCNGIPAEHANEAWANAPLHTS